MRIRSLAWLTRIDEQVGGAKQVGGVEQVGGVG